MPIVLPFYVAALAASPIQSSLGTPTAPAAITTQVRSAALFKNGLAFVQRTGTAPAGATQARIDALPVPTHGTFCISPGPGTPAIVSAVARKTERVERVPATDLQELLLANVGRKLTLVLSEKDSLSGALLAMPEPRVNDDLDQPRYGYQPPPTHSLLYLDTGGGVTAAFDPHQVLRLSASEGALNREFERRRPGSSLTIALASAANAPAPVELSYLERGLTWVPSYSIDISDTGKALLSAKAEVFDESEELAGATLQFVTGYPNLQFAHVVDPIALRGELEAFFSALGEPAQQRAQVLSQSVMSNALGGLEGAAERASLPGAAGPLPGAGIEDLFFYEQRGVTLARGERGLYPLFSARVGCEHLYEWEIADTVLDRPQPERDGRERPQEEIWHSLRLTNDTGLPWTTAPAMTVKDASILGQDTLHYTAVGAKTTVRITRALDIQGEPAEIEQSRERNAAKYYGSNYDRVTVHGELHITNFKRESVQLEIRKRIQGELTKNPAQAAVVALAEGLRQVNPNRRLSWSVTLEAGKPLTIEYEYTLFVRG